MQSKLLETTKKYAKSNPIRFHMPAHNGEDIGICTDMDITELSFSDNLLESDGVIANCEKNIANAYGTNFALMLTTGATIGIAIALHAAKNKGKNLLLIGDMHKSVLNWAMIFDFNVTKANSLYEKNANDFDVVVVTSPDYFGNTKDISLLKETNAFVIVDASHGSHFPFCKQLPNLPIEIADIVVLSFHKTLPVLTGGAGLLCNDRNTYDMLLYGRSIIHSTSPSYLTMASIDKAICDFSKTGQSLYDECLKNIEQFKHSLCNRYDIVQNDDITRLCISTKGKSGEKIAKKLEAQNIFLEMSYQDLLVAIVTPFNSKHLKVLANALNSIETNCLAEKINLPEEKKASSHKDNVVFVDIANSAGKVCAANIGVYPPGTPILTVSDIIDSSIAEFLCQTEYEVFGLVDGKIPVFED